MMWLSSALPGISSSPTSTLHILPSLLPPFDPITPRPAGINSSSPTRRSQLPIATSLPHTLVLEPKATTPVELVCILCLDVSVLYSSYAMAKLHVSVSRMMSRRAAAISIAKSSSARDCKRWSLESGGERGGRVDMKDFPVNGRDDGVSDAMGRMQVVRKDETDLLR